MKTVGERQSAVHELRRAIAELEPEVAKAKGCVDELEKVLESRRERAEEQRKANDSDESKSLWGLFFAAIVERIQQEREEVRQLSATYRGMARLLGRTECWTPASVVDEADLAHEGREREEMLHDVQAVLKMVEALGECDAARRLPIEALGRIEGALLEELEPLRNRRDEVLASHPKTSALIPQQLKFEDAIHALSERLELKRIPQHIFSNEKKSFRENMVATALLVDQATTTADYHLQRMNRDYPRSLIGYRNREYWPWDQYAALPRQLETKAHAQKILNSVLKSRHPEKAIAHALPALFLNEIGVRPHTAAKWKVNIEAVRTALAHELIAPLRALNETVGDMVKGEYGLKPPPDIDMRAKIQRAVDAITRHVLEGDFREWRYSNKESLRQLAMLTEHARETWKSCELLCEHTGASGQKLRTREVDGLDLFWVPKIGGPSHGFDKGGHCLLPLLANGRTKAIVVDDESWPSNPSARAYIRVLPDEDGRATLYLEPTQRDFPHRLRDHDEEHGNREWRAAECAILKHALAKAKAMNVPLSVPDSYRSAANELGFSTQELEQRFILHPSGGVREASDSLIPDAHDWVNLDEQKTPALRRLLIS